MKPLLLPFGCLLTGLATLGLTQAASSVGERPALSAWIPEQASVCVEIYQPGPLLGPLLRASFADKVAALPAYDRRRDSKQIQDLAGIGRLLEGTAGTNWQGAIRKLSSEGFALALGGDNRRLLILGGEDPGLLEQLHAFGRQLAIAEAGKQGQEGRVRSMDHAGVTGWTFDGKEAHALVDQRFLSASDPEVLKMAIDLRTSGGGGLAARADYQAARRAVGKDATGMVFLDLQRLREAPQFLSALDEQRQNPLVALLLAGLSAPLKSAPWVALGVYLETDELVLRAYAGGDRSQLAPAAFARASGPAGPSPTPLEVPRRIASLNLYRDLAGFYGAKDTLFPQRTSGLIFFENMMGIFFSGRNLTDEVLAQTQPWIQVVTARQEYDPSIGTPEPQWPAFAVVFELRNPNTFGEVVEEAWQKALGLINFTRGQKALPGLILDRVDHKGTSITVARYSAKEVPDRNHLDARFNVRPSLALAKGHAILSSTDQLARDLVDALAKTPSPEAAAPTGIHTSLRFSGSELAAILKSNRPSLVQANMLKESKPRTEAEITIDTLCILAGWADQLTVQVGQGKRDELLETRLSFTKP